MAKSFYLGGTAFAFSALLMASAVPSRSQTAGEMPRAKPSTESPLSMVNALHTAFGEHHARAVHTKGVMLEGVFTPTREAAALTKAPAFSGGPLPVTARFSLFAGVPDLPDNDDGASPAGFAFKIKASDGDDLDVEANQHGDFITATFDEFAVFLRAVGAAGKGDKAPLESFLATHPHAKAFLGSRTYPASYAQATYFGINALKFTNAAGRSAFVRYRFTPHAPERYLSQEERKSAGSSYLGDEIVSRVRTERISFDWYAQIAGPGDRIDDPSTAWPATRKLVKLGTITLTRLPANPDEAQRTLLFLPGQPHPGIEAADPMLVMRNVAYPISLGQRQSLARTPPRGLPTRRRPPPPGCRAERRTALHSPALAESVRRSSFKGQKDVSAQCSCPRPQFPGAVCRPNGLAKRSDLERRATRSSERQQLSGGTRRVAVALPQHDAPSPGPKL